jgi:hypothetical protein
VPERAGIYDRRIARSEVGGEMACGRAKPKAVAAKAGGQHEATQSMTSFSTRATEYPRFAATYAAEAPTMPPPMTTTSASAGMRDRS